jgi:hypothetical protein
MLVLFQLAGKARLYRWRKNIKTESGARFGDLMENGFLNSCPKNCRYAHISRICKIIV